MPGERAETSPRRARLAEVGFLFGVLARTLAWRIRSLRRGSRGETRAERFWDLMARDFDRHAARDQMRRIHLETLERVRRHLEAGDVVLDYGCGTGTFALELADGVKRIRAVDLSSKMIDAARAKAAAAQVENVRFERATIFDPGLAQEPFDAVLALNVLHLAEDPSGVVLRIRELLRPGGRLLSATECMGEGGPLIRTLLRLSGWIGITPSFRFLRLADVDRVLAEAGFETVDSACAYGDGSQPNYFVCARKP